MGGHWVPVGRQEGDPQVAAGGADPVVGGGPQWAEEAWQILEQGEEQAAGRGKFKAQSHIASYPGSGKGAFKREPGVSRLRARRKIHQNLGFCNLQYFLLHQAS